MAIHGTQQKMGYQSVIEKPEKSTAGIAQLVEHNLAKVGVASSNLVSRSKISIQCVIVYRLAAFSPPFCYTSLAGWQSGYAAACKAVDAGSIPTSASIIIYE